MLKMVLKLALIVIGILVIPLGLAIAGAIWPVVVAAFCLLFPLVAIGAIIGWKMKH